MEAEKVYAIWDLQIRKLIESSEVTASGVVGTPQAPCEMISMAIFS
jgi:hypothetical protein